MIKKLFWSTFALSLILTPGHAQVVELDDYLPALDGPQKFSPKDLHQTQSWNVKEQDVLIDVEPLKGQSFSSIPWKSQDPEDFLDINVWLRERALKDKTPDWKIRVRNDSQLELMGKVLKCYGTCRVFRGIESAHVEHLSRLVEGDELQTEENSVAWVYLMDGSLMRLGPSSSIAVKEINFSSQEVFILLRLNQGHVFWHPRKKGEHLKELGPETDTVSLPLMIKEVNQQFFERMLFQKQSDSERLAAVMELDEPAVLAQLGQLNEMKAAHDPLLEVQTRVMIVAPNATLVSQKVSFDFLYLTGGKSYFSKRDHQDGEEFNLHQRGYSQMEVTAIKELGWHEIDPTGRSFTLLGEAPGNLQILELLTRRIKTLELAREYWIRDFTLPLIESLKNPGQLAVNHGYSLWEKEKQDQRFQFLVEYTRRIETTHLRSLENLLIKLEGQGEKIERELSQVYYQDALKHYLKGLKTRYTSKKMQVSEMSDLQYYVWILKNGKI